MGTISEIDGRWRVEISGTTTCKSFATYGRAQAWLSRYEAAQARKAAEGAPDASQATLGDLLRRYAREVSTLKRGASVEHYKLGMMAAAPIGQILVNELTAQDLATYRNDRLALVANSTVRQELCLIRRTIETARREWGCALPDNPAAMVTLPKPGPSRDRRLRPGELEALREHLEAHPVAWALVRFLVETAMRRGEALGLQWRDIDLGERLAHLRMTKNGSARTVALTDGAVEVLKGLKPPNGLVFPIDISALRWAWGEACRKAGIADLRLHDLRHEGVSRLFEVGLTVMEVQLMSGHKTVSSLFRYTHLRPVELVNKLRGVTLGTFSNRGNSTTSDCPLL